MGYTLLQIGLITGIFVAGFHLSKKYVGVSETDYIGVTICSTVTATIILLAAKELDKL